jgi:hypothetical protein
MGSTATSRLPRFVPPLPVPRPYLKASPGRVLIHANAAVKPCLAAGRVSTFPRERPDMPPIGHSGVARDLKSENAAESPVDSTH